MDKFFEEKMKRIFTEKKTIIDIGGGLRTDPERNNRGKENVWLRLYVGFGTENFLTSSDTQDKS